MTEQEFGIEFDKCLQSIGFETWKEVFVSYSGKSIDLIGKLNNEYYSFELKLTLNDNVLEQAKRNLSYTKYSYIVVPYKSNIWGRCKNKISYVKKYFMIQHGIGLILFSEKSTYNYPYTHLFGKACYYLCSHPIESLRPKEFNPDKLINIEQFLFNDQKESLAGSKSGGVITPFKRSCGLIIDYLEGIDEKVTKKHIWEKFKTDLHWKNYNSFCSSINNYWNVKEIKKIHELLGRFD